MAITVHIQCIDKAEITTTEYPDFATTLIEGDGNRVALFFDNHAQAKLVSAALHNDRAALRAMLADPAPTARFKAGEAYRMRDGGKCRIVHVEDGGDGIKSVNGERYHMIGVYDSPVWAERAPAGYDLRGHAISPTRAPELDLVQSEADSAEPAS